MSEPLQRTVRVRCPLAHAFDVFTARLDLWWPQKHRRFGASQLFLEARVGGRFFERSDTGEEARLGEVVRCEPPHRITYTWYPGAVSGPTEVDVRFTGEGEHTVVEVLHSEGQSGLGDAWPQRVELFGRAWAHVLPAFAGFISRGENP
jgi:uncharacterized protein YndB with AHSA1/START domain